jgi:molybdopterin/thiamine biosynthesis adenylyltransferase
MKPLTDPDTPSSLPPLTNADRARYEWQLSTADFGEEGQRKLKAARVLISRTGGVGSAAAYYVAAAGVGKLLLAHGGIVRPSDLNRQILMTTDAVDQPRVESSARRLRDLNPTIEIEAVPENITPQNAAALIAKVDLIINAAPLFEERLAMNREVVRQRKIMIDCAMYDFDAQVTTIIPGQTPCLACLVSAPPPQWRREFPVFGAVSGVVGTLGAVEAIKVLAGIGQPLTGRMLLANLRDMSFRTLTLKRNPNCPVCRDL